MANNKMREQMSKAFLEALSLGRIPWQACWTMARPYNGASGRKYHGTNAAYLSYVADEKGYTDPRWATYKQALDKGWQVRKGEKGTHVEYWAWYDHEKKKLLDWSEAKKLQGTEYAEKNLSLRCYISTVFNADQMDCVPPLQQNMTDIGALRARRDSLVNNMAVGYREEGSRAYYTPGADIITLPPEGSFSDTYAYMSTFLHEAGHATGHHTRLDRDLTGFKGSESYAREELRAEIASAFAAQEIGLQVTPAQLQYHIQQHKAYIQSWAAALQEAPNELYAAIRDAEKIADYLLEKGEFEPVQVHSEQESDIQISSPQNATEQLADLWQRDGQTDRYISLEYYGTKILQQIGRKSINDFSEEEIAKTEFMARRYWAELGAKSPYFRAAFGDWRAHDTTPVQIANQSGSSRGIQQNADTGWDINISRKVFSETQSHSDSPNKAAVEYLKYLEDIVRKAVLLDSTVIPAEKAKSQNSLLMHSMYALADAGHGQEILKLYVEEMVDPNSGNTSKRAYQLQNIEKYRHRQMSSQLTASSISVDGDIKNVSQLFAFVKSRDAKFMPREVDLSMLQANGYPELEHILNYDKELSNEVMERNNPQLSEAELFRLKLNAWVREGMPDGAVFILGSTGQVLQALGAIESDIYIWGDKIKDILNHHPEMTLREIGRIPEMLDDPILILKSQNAWHASVNTRLVMFGTVKARDGNPVMNVLDLRPVENRLVLDDMQKVVSSYTKTVQPVQFFSNSEALYVDKKRTPALLRSIGFNVPIELQRSGYVGSISYKKRNVNMTGLNFSELLRTHEIFSSNHLEKSVPPQQNFVSPERVEDLVREWDMSDQMDDEEYRDWYTELSEQEKTLVDSWDKKYEAGILKMSQATLSHEQKAISQKTEPVEFYYAKNLALGGLTLHITGPVDLPDYDSELQRPWQDRINEITQVTVEDGVSSIGSRALYRMPELKKVSLGADIRELSYLAMDDCPKLQIVEFSGDMESWERVEKGWNFLPSQFSQEAWERRWSRNQEGVKESYMPIGARLDADGRSSTVSTDFTPDALIRASVDGQTSTVVAPNFRTESWDASEASIPEMELEI